MQKQLEVYQFSNYQKIHAYVTPSEIEALLLELKPEIYALGAITSSSKISIEQFIESYTSYFGAIERGEDDLFSYRAKLQVAFCQSKEELLEMQLANGVLYKPLKPVVLTRLCFVGKNEQEKTIHPMVFGPGSFPWGLQFSFPAVVQEKSSGEILKGRDFTSFSLFSKLQKWMRHHTKPASFFFGDYELKTALRKGKIASSHVVFKHP